MEDTVRLVMRKVAANELWSLFSLKGRKGKTCLLDYKVYGLIKSEHHFIIFADAVYL